MTMNIIAAAPQRVNSQWRMDWIVSSIRYARCLRPTERQIAHIRVCFSLPAEGRHLAVAGDEMHVVTERPKASGNRIDQLLMIAPRQVGAADGARKQHVPDKRDLGGTVVKNDMTRCVAGTVAHAHLDLAE